MSLNLRGPKSARVSISAGGSLNTNPGEGSPRITAGSLSKSFSNLKDLLKSEKEGGPHKDKVKCKLKKCGSMTGLALDNYLSLSELAEETPVHIAACKGDLPLLKKLLKRFPALLNRPDCNGWTALHCASAGGHLDVVEYLLRLPSCDLFAITKEKSSAIHYLARKPILKNTPRASAEEHYCRVLQLAIDCGIFVNAQNVLGETPLHSACLRSNYHGALILLRHNASPNICSSAGETTLHYAVRTGSPELVKLLTSHGADPRVTSHSGVTPIGLATEYNHLEILEHLTSVSPSEEKVGRRISLRVTDPLILKQLIPVSRLATSQRTSAPCLPVHKDGALRKGFLYFLQDKYWFRLWFVLKHFALSYSANPHDAEPMGEICLEWSSVYSVKGEIQHRSKCFRLVVEGIPYFFSSECKSDRDQWLSVLSSLHTISSFSLKHLTPANLRPSPAILQSLTDLLYQVPNSPQPDVELQKFLLEGSFEGVEALCYLELEEDEEFLRLLMEFFAYHNKTLSFLKWAISKEIKKTLSGPTLFRARSLATQLMNLYTFEKLGLDYLHIIVYSLVNEICSSKESYEIDPNKVSDPSEVANNLARLLRVCESFLYRVITHVLSCPLSFRILLKHASDETALLFPDMKRLVVGGFIFLRFLCPAIVTPEKYSLVSAPPTKESRRTLILISKILQSLANTVQFDGSKEGYMSSINDFVTYNFEAVNNFYDQLTDFEVDELSLDVAEKQFPRSNISLPKTITNIYKMILSKQDQINHLIGKDN